MSSAEDPAMADDMENDEECPVLEPNEEVNPHNQDDITADEVTEAEEHGGNDSDPEDSVLGQLEQDGELMEIDETKDIQDNKPLSSQQKGQGLNKKPGGSSSRSTDSNSTFDIVTRKRAASITTTHEDSPKAKLGRNSTTSIQISKDDDKLDNEEKEEVEDSSNSEGGEDMGDEFHDKYCWVCHKTGIQVNCRICPRSYHNRCVPEVHVDENRSCVCPECNTVMKAENINHRSEAMKLMTMDQLMDLLQHICSRMKMTPGADPFLTPVQREDAEDYYDYVVYPMDIGTLENNIKMKQYGSTEAFLADAQWIVHNSIIFNTASSPYTAAAKRLLKVCKQELAEIETCPECYSNAHTNPNWFVEPCRRPHLLVWAKLKGFPFWPAKAMKIHNDQVDVRFFGQHDRAWVNLKDCFLYSIEQPSTAPKKSAQLAAAIDELNQHVDKLKEIYEEVTFAEPKTEIGPTLSVDQIRRLLPKYVGEEPSKHRVSTQVKPKSATKSPVTLTISSLKTTPVIKSNSAAEENFVEDDVSDEDMDDGGQDQEGEEQEEQVSPTPITTNRQEDDELTLDKPSPDETEIQPKLSDSGTGPESPKSEDESRVPSGILASALGLRRVTRRQSANDEQVKKSEAEPKGKIEEPTLSIKTEADPEEKDNYDDPDEPDLHISEESLLPKKISKAQDLMEQISSQAQTKPGYRFNISKDISISAIGEDGEEPAASASPTSQVNIKSTIASAATAIRKSLGYHVVPTNQDQRLVRPNPGAGPIRNVVVGGGMKQSIQSQIQQQRANLNVRPATPPGTSGPRYFLNKDGSIRPVVKAGNQSIKQQIQQQAQQQQVRSLIRPTINRGGAPLRPIAPKVDHPVGGSSEHGGNQGSTSLAGAITLPGGTITVTPLTPTMPASSSMASTHIGNINGQVNGISGMMKTTPTRRGGPALPQSINTHIANCMKVVQEQLRSSIEHIASDIIDSGVGSKPDSTAFLKEKEQLLLKHAKELADLRHNHDIAIRELRTSLESDKRKQMNDLRRQFDLDKARALDEAKKKQWCARCSREAQFYCCWNTSYCGYHCQEEHWPAHMASCTQNKTEAGAE